MLPLLLPRERRGAVPAQGEGLPAAPCVPPRVAVARSGEDGGLRWKRLRLEPGAPLHSLCALGQVTKRLPKLLGLQTVYNDKVWGTLTTSSALLAAWLGI